MNSTTLDVVYVTRSPWEFGWDAVVGLATLFLALATVAAVVVPIWIEARRKRDHAAEWKKQASYIALAFDHELHMVEQLAASAIEMMTDLTPDYAAALHAGDEWLTRTNVPLLTKFSNRVNRFDSRTAELVLVALSRVLQAKMNTPIPDRGGLPRELLEKSVEAKLKEANVIRDAAAEARAALKAHFREGVSTHFRES